MKRLSLLVGLLAGSLAGCGAFPIQLPLPDQSFTLGAATPTAGKVFYPKSAAKFDRPVINVKDISLAGKVGMTSALNLKLKIYARTTAPTACQDLGDYYACNASNETPISSELDLTGGSSNFNLAGAALTTGVNQGEVWMGLEVTSGGTAGGTVKLSNMTASITLL